MTHYIGLDAHSKTSTFVTTNNKGKVVAQSQVATTEGNLRRFVRSLKGTKKLVYEESSLSNWLYCVFDGEVESQVVCNSVYLGKKQGPKGDYRDGLHLSNELRCGHIESVYHEQHPFMEMRALTSAYLDLVREIIRTKNRYKALFRSEAISTTGQAIYDEPDRINELSRHSDRFVAKQLMAQLQLLEQSKKEYKAEFKKNRKNHTIIKRLDTVPGFDIVRSHIVASLVCSADRFKDKHKFWAYSMLVKYRDVSDGRVYATKKIHGRTELKGVFDGAALSILRGNSSLRKYYDRLRSKGLDHRTAKKAVARKIAAICLSIMKRGNKYDDKYEEKQRRIAKKQKV